MGGIPGHLREHRPPALTAHAARGGCLYLLERGRYVPNGAEYTRSMLDDLDEAVRGLHEFLAAQSP